MNVAIDTINSSSSPPCLPSLTCGIHDDFYNHERLSIQTRVEPATATTDIAAAAETCSSPKENNDRKEEASLLCCPSTAGPTKPLLLLFPHEMSSSPPIVQKSFPSACNFSTTTITTAETSLASVEQEKQEENNHDGNKPNSIVPLPRDHTEMQNGTSNIDPALEKSNDENKNICLEATTTTATKKIDVLEIIPHHPHLSDGAPTTATSSLSSSSSNNNDNNRWYYRRQDISLHQHNKRLQQQLQRRAKEQSVGSIVVVKASPTAARHLQLQLGQPHHYHYRENDGDDNINDDNNASHSVDNDEVLFCHHHPTPNHKLRSLIPTVASRALVPLFCPGGNHVWRLKHRCGQRWKTNFLRIRLMPKPKFVPRKCFAKNKYSKVCTNHYYVSSILLPN